VLRRSGQRLICLWRGKCDDILTGPDEYGRHYWHCTRCGKVTFAFGSHFIIDLRDILLDTQQDEEEGLSW